MDINQAFPSKYLKSSELEGHRPIVTIAKVTIEEVGREREPRPILYFKGKTKGMVLNKTNAFRIQQAYGRLTENWIGHRIQIFEEQVPFGREIVPGLRVAIPEANQVSQRAQAPIIEDEGDERVPGPKRVESMGNSYNPDDLDGDVVPF